MTDETGRLCVYNGGLLMRRPERRILELAGWDVATGVPGEGDHVGVWGRTATAWRGEAMAEWKDAPVVRIEDAFLRSVLPCLLYTSPSPRDQRGSRMPSSA